MTKEDKVCGLPHGLDFASIVDIRMSRNKREESYKILREMEESFRKLESHGLVPRGYVRYMNDMILTIEHRITYRL
jgi:hypothetical protein